MDIRITNLTRRLVVINLNSGRSVILGPEGTSDKIPATETRGNRMVEKMKREGIIYEKEDEPSGKVSTVKTTHGKKR